jgi:hypothetical protein
MTDEKGQSKTQLIEGLLQTGILDDDQFLVAMCALDPGIQEVLGMVDEVRLGLIPEVVERWRNIVNDLDKRTQFVGFFKV